MFNSLQHLHVSDTGITNTMACDMKRNRTTERFLLSYFEYICLRKDITACTLSDGKNGSHSEATHRLTEA
jgi:hypothetical protein